MPRRRQHLVVIGDLVDSRSIRGKARRESFQADLRELFSDIGHDAGLVSPYTITLGDEFQAVYRDAAGLFRHWFRIRSRIMPQRVRFSIALGPLDTAINPDQAIGMDGPAFHLAREAMNQLKKDGDLLRITAPDGILPGIVGPMVRLLAAETDGWNANRLAIIHRMLGGLSGETLVSDLDIPGMLEISPSAVYKNIRTARLDTWVELLHQAELELSRMLR